MMLTLLPDMNIAPLKYAHVQKTPHGGPVESVTFRERQLPSGKMFEAFATLDEKATGLRSPSPTYAHSHGTGLAATKPEAIYCAISEAMERWAWHVCAKDPALRESLRFDLDPTTAGFAAFPGLGVQGAKKRAFFEAAKLWSISSWWEGKLPHKEIQVPGLSAISVQTSVPGIAVVVLWEEAGGKFHFGSGASYSQAPAVELARLGLQHHRDMLEFCESSSATLGLEEKRMQHFSTATGFASFRERLGKPGTQAPAPGLAVDLSVRGPWTQYAHVWRCLFDMSAARGKDRDDYFLL